MACPSIPQATTGDSRVGDTATHRDLGCSLSCGATAHARGNKLWPRQQAATASLASPTSASLHRQGQSPCPPAHSRLLPTGLLHLAEEGGWEGSCSGGSGGFANGSKAFPPGAGGKRGHSRRGASREVGGRRWKGRREAGVAACKKTEKRGCSAGRGGGGQECALGKA